MFHFIFALAPVVGETMTAWETPLGFVGKTTVAPKGPMAAILVVFA